ncbi:MAG: hypothetical protein IJL87_09815, partial [Clostridia bacterium]|nr:hypothetical protein [Clostridia bacterium]
MKWPKLKNYVVCMFLLFLPALLLLAAGIGSMFLADKYGDWLGFLGLIFIASPLVYIFGCFATLGCMEAVLKWVKSRINAPVRYDYSGNGTTASRIEETIVSR